MSTIVKLTDIYKSYQQGESKETVLKDINLEIYSGDLFAIMGPSGAGKSTLMNILGVLDKPDRGSYLLNTQEVTSLGDDEQAVIRNRDIGFIFQSFYLLPRLTALQNVYLPLFYKGMDIQQSKVLALQMLTKVGMERFAKQKPNQLSGGQQQRVAIARALVGRPSLVLADEPTGALDSTIGQDMMDFLVSLNKNDKTTIIIITHDINIAEQCRRVVYINDGKIEPAQ